VFFPNPSGLPDICSAAQPIEITQFRLTGAFLLAYTRLAASHWRCSHFRGFKEEAQGKRFKRHGFHGRLISFVFWVLIVSWVIKLVGRLLRGGFAAAVTGTPLLERERRGAGCLLSSKRLVRDPVCGCTWRKSCAAAERQQRDTLFLFAECREI